MLMNLLEDVPMNLWKKIVFMHDNVPSQSAKAATWFLALMWFKNDTLMEWSACSSDLNLIENICAIIKRTVYTNIRQCSFEDNLWKAVQDDVPSI